MYLPNPDVGPIGAEPGEFIDWPLLSDHGPRPPLAPDPTDPTDPTDAASGVSDPEP